MVDARNHLPRDYFVPANQVRITDPESAHHGRVGEISIYDEVTAGPDDPPYQVTFNRDLGDAAWFFADEMELVE